MCVPGPLTVSFAPASSLAALMSEVHTHRTTHIPIRVGITICTHAASRCAWWSYPYTSMHTITHSLYWLKCVFRRGWRAAQLRRPGSCSPIQKGREGGSSTHIFYMWQRVGALSRSDFRLPGGCQEHFFSRKPGTHTPTHMRTHVHTHTRIYTQACSQIRAQFWRLSLVHPLTHPPSRPHLQVARTHVRTSTRTRTHTLTHTHTYTHMYTHVQALDLIDDLVSLLHGFMLVCHVCQSVLVSVSVFVSVLRLMEIQGRGSIVVRLLV